MSRISIGLLLLSIVLFGLLVGAVYASSKANSYDVNGNGFIDKYEATAGIKDYFDGEISQGEAVDLLLYHFSHDSLAPLATWTPTSTPTLASASQITGMLDCHSRSEGAVNYYLTTVVSRVSRHVEVTFTNPSESEWQYGLFLREKYSYPRVQFIISHKGEWYLIKWWGTGANEYVILDYGNFARENIPFNAGAGESNQITYLTQIQGKGDRFYVNGEKLWTPSIRSQTTSNSVFPSDYEQFRQLRNYYLWGWLPTMNQYTTEGKNKVISYEGLCTQDSWTYTR